jgi:hypothetical protein
MSSRIAPDLLKIINGLLCPKVYVVYRVLGFNSTGEETYDKRGLVGIYNNKEEAFAAAIINEMRQTGEDIDSHYDSVLDDILVKKYDKLEEYFVKMSTKGNGLEENTWSTKWFSDLYETYRNFGGGDSEVYFKCLVSEMFIKNSFNVSDYIERFPDFDSDSILS